MKASSIAIALIWVIFLFDAFRQGREVPVSAVAQQIRLDWFGQVALFLPFVFFLFAAFFQRHKQFSYPLVTRAVDGKLGPGTFAGFISRLRPVTLFMLACLTLGTTGLLSTYLTTQEIGGYIVSGFFTSAGLGLLVAYLLSIKFPPKLA
jgi:hypothetical protein